MRACLLTFLAGLAIANTPLAQAVETASLATVCGQLPAVASTILSELEFEELRRDDPAKALAQACSTWRNAVAVVDRNRAAQRVAAALSADGGRYAEATDVAEAVRLALGEPGQSNRADLGTIHALLGEIATGQRDIAAAEPHFAAARAHLEAAGATHTSTYAMVLTGQALVWRKERIFADAEAALAQAEAVLQVQGLGISRQASDVLNARAMLAYERQDFRATIAFTQAEIAMMRQVSGENDPELLHAYATLGAVFSQLSEFDAAEAALREGLRIVELAPEREPAGQLGMLHNLARLHGDRGQYQTALAIAERGVVLAEKHFGASNLYLLAQLLSLAGAHEGLGQLGLAQAAYARARVMADANIRSMSLLNRARLSAGQASVAFHLGDVDAARAHREELLAVVGDATGQDWYRGQAAKIACWLAARASAWEEVDRHCADMAGHFALALGQEHGLVFGATAQRCIAQTAGGMTGDACAETSRRVNAGAAGHPYHRFIALTALADRAEADGETETSLRLRMEALAVAETLAVPDPLWIAYARLARLLNAQDDNKGDKALAIFFGKQAIVQIERLRGAVAVYDQRYDRGFIQDKISVYRSVADWLMEAGRIDEALDVLRLLKNEEFYDFVLRDAAWKPAERGGVLSPAEQELLQRYTLAMQPDLAAGEEIDRLSRLKDGNRISAAERERLAALQAGQAGAERLRIERLREFVARTPAASPSAEAKQDVRAENLAREVQRFGGDTALAFYLMTDTGLRVLVATRQGVESFESRIDPGRLALMIGQYLEAISERRDVAAASAALYEQIGWRVDEAARRAGAQRLVLWLDGPLRYLPFASLHDGKRYLIEKYAIEHMLPTPQPASPTRAEQRRGEGLRALGVTRAMSGMPALPGIAHELCDIVRGPVLGLAGEPAACAASGQAQGAQAGAGYANDYFTQARMQSLLTQDRDFALLHLGSHFALRPGNIARSWLLLGDGGRLTLDAMREFDFGGLRLVTLSACQTGMAGAIGDDGREIEGLPALMHRQGAGAVISSLWRVEDKSAARLMKSFYAGMGEGRNSLAEALRQASLQFINQPSKNQKQKHPYYWAPFILTTTSSLQTPP